MRGSLSHARLLAAAFVVAVTAVAGVSSASATTSTGSANGLSVTASLSPDTVAKGNTVSQDVMVKNSSASTESVTIRIVGPLPAATQIRFAVTLQPGKSFERSASFPAALLSPGTHTLTVTAANRASGEIAQARASVTRT